MSLTSWLKQHSSWMNNPNVLAQFGHAGIPYGALLTLDKFQHPVLFWAFAAGVIAFAGVKEFYYDKIFETPRQTFANNLTDFSFYCLGVGLANVVHYF
jgi:hypothetical protein